MNLAASVFVHAQQRPEATALVVDGAAWSYAELWSRAARYAAALLERGPAPRVGLLGVRKADTYAALLGIAAAGGTYVPLSPNWPRARIESILARADLSALALPESHGEHAELSSSFGAARTLLPSQIDRFEPIAQPLAVSPEQIAYVIFTSGSTGIPKGVSIRCGGVASFLNSIEGIYSFDSTDRFAQFSQLSFDFSVFELFSAWRAGASVWVVPDGKMIAPTDFIRASSITVWASVPSVISLSARLKKLEPASLPSLKVSIFSGEALLAESAQAWRAAAPNSVIDNHWGATEITVMCTLERVGETPNVTPRHSTISIGKPYADMQMAVLGEAGNFAAAGEQGELIIAGPQLAEGYYGDAEKTAERFVPLEREGKLERWYRTGDLVFQDAGGSFHYAGRNDTQVKIRGYRIELGEIETRIREVAGTDAVAAIAWPRKLGMAEGIVAFIGRAGVAPESIRTALRLQLPTYMMPARIIARATLPLNDNGKIDRKALEELLRGEAASS